MILALHARTRLALIPAPSVLCKEPKPPFWPVAYLDAPELSKFVADDSARLIAAVKKIGKVE